MNKYFLKFALGVAAGAGLAMAAQKYAESDMGRAAMSKLRKKMIWVQNMGPMKYKFLVAMAAKKFGKTKELPEETVQDIINQTYELWDSFSDER